MDVEFPQSLEIVLSPPNFHNRLFIYTGTAFGAVPELGPRDDDDWSTSTVIVDLTRWHGGRVFNPATTIAIASASLASINGSDNANDSTWAVNRSFTAIVPEPGTEDQPAGTLQLHADVAVRGQGNLVWRISYQIFIQTIGFSLLPLMAPNLPTGVITIPQGSSESFTLIGSISMAPTTPEPILVLPDTGAGAVTIFPQPVTVAAGSTSFGVTVTIKADTFPVGVSPLKITASGALDSQSIVVMVKQL
jgi:hypothetical protein